MKKFGALFCRKDSAYKNRPHFDVFDADRGALTFKGGMPVVCHPPCRKWGVLSHMAHRARPGEELLALNAIEFVRENGGILEHPKGSRLFGKHVPDAGKITDNYGGFTILIDQFDFGHIASKPTKLYICGLKRWQLPTLPPRRTEEPERSICGGRGKTRCTQYQREYTPEPLIDWFEEVLTIIAENKSNA